MHNSLIIFNFRLFYSFNLSVTPYLCLRNHKTENMKETTGADFKSATDSENKKLFIETYGCQMNVADSEVIASIMQMAGYHVCETLDEADAVFMNTCSIRDNAEQKILNRLEFSIL